MSSLFLAHLRFSAPAMRFPCASERSLRPPSPLSFPHNLSLLCRPMGISSARLLTKFEAAFAGGNGNNGNDHRGGGGRGGGNGGSGEESEDGHSGSESSVPQNGVSMGWREGVEVDPQFPLRVLMEEVIWISACVLGDTACRSNFDFSQLNFVFSTLVIGSILESVLMFYHLLISSSVTFLNLPPAILANSPKTHILTAAGFASGLVGTAISYRLIKMARKIDPESEPPSYPRSPVLNAFTWAIHLGISSSLRCQMFAGINSLLAKLVPPMAFNRSVLALRCLNGILGGMSFVMLVNMIKLMEKDERIKKREREMNSKLSEERRITLKFSPVNPLFTFWLNDEVHKGQIVRSTGLNILICSMLFTHTITGEEETDS